MGDKGRTTAINRRVQRNWEKTAVLGRGKGGSGLGLQAPAPGEDRQEEEEEEAGGESTVRIRDKLASVTWEDGADLGRGKSERSILAAPSRRGAG